MRLNRPTGAAVAVLLGAALLGWNGSSAMAAGPSGGTAPPGQSFGPAADMHVVVGGTQATGYRADVYDGNTFVTGRGMVGSYDMAVVPGTSAQAPGGPNLLGDQTTGDLSWQGPVGLQAGAGDGGTVVSGTAPNGSSGVNWTQASAPANTWIYVQPTTELTAGEQYQAQITVQGSGDVFLDFYNGQEDLTSQTVQLSSTPTTLTVDGLVPQASTNTPLQVRTASAGAVDLWATSASIQLLQPETLTSQEELQNRYRNVSYDTATKTLTLSGAVNTVGDVQVSRYETYRFVSPDVIAARLGVKVSEPAVLWYSPYTDFNSAMKPLWVGGYSSDYSSPGTTPEEELSDSPIPVLGVADGDVTYGVASDSTWDDPIPGYDSPPLVIDGNRLSAPQIGTQTSPVTLGAGQSESWGQVLFRGGAGTYGLALGGEMAMGAALGFNQQNSPGAGSSGTAADFGVISRVTAYWAREGTTSGSKSLVPSSYYGPSTYMRDSFWTALALEGTQFGASTETNVMDAFTDAVPTTGSDAGHVPDTESGPYYPDESGLYYLIRMENDVNQLHLSVENLSVAKLVLEYIENNQVSDGAFETAAPANYGNGFDISPDSWLDGYLYPAGQVDAYDQGLYVVALEAAQRLGLGVTSAQISQADAVYRSLYDPQLGYVRWLTGTTYKSPDVLAGDALSLYLFDQPLLPASEVVSTLKAQVVTPNGTMDLATSDDGYVPADQFLTLQTNAQGQVEGVGEPAGWYQNGGSWFLWTYLADYAALRAGYQPAAKDIDQAVSQELEVTPLSKEFQLTENDPSVASVDPAYPYPLGSSGIARQAFGWNTAFVTLQASLAHAPAPLPPLG
jgi:hypothetical protein